MTTWTPLPVKRIEIDGKRCHQGLAFAGLHFGDAAFVLHHAADQLDVEMALAEGPPGGLAHGGEGRHEKIVEALAGGQLLLEHGGAASQRLVGQGLHFRLQGVDLGHDGAVLGDLAVVAGAENLCGNTAQSEHLIRSFREGQNPGVEALSSQVAGRGQSAR